MHVKIHTLSSLTTVPIASPIGITQIREDEENNIKTINRVETTKPANNAGSGITVSIGAMAGRRYEAILKMDFVPKDLKDTANRAIELMDILNDPKKYEEAWETLLKPEISREEYESNPDTFTRKDIKGNSTSIIVSYEDFVKGWQSFNREDITWDLKHELNSLNRFLNNYPPPTMEKVLYEYRAKMGTLDIKESLPPTKVIPFKDRSYEEIMHAIKLTIKSFYVNDNLIQGIDSLEKLDKVCVPDLDEQAEKAYREYIDGNHENITFLSARRINKHAKLPGEI